MKHKRIYFDTEIRQLPLHVRTINCLDNGNVLTVEDLLKLREEQLLRFRNLGRGRLKEIKDLLASYGLKLKGAR